MQLLYFAWVREKIGRSGESLELPPGIVTVADLVRWLSARGPEYAEAFARPDLVRAALDQSHVKPETPLGRVREIAFFPPVTGG
ncbi:MAG: molybdopterin converting factor subunit 1 [Hyphomicrobiaceae bacterium]|nr:molybdopterin converting factor subunit 1 [Hyphomicrobiaceae bacterium]